MILEWLVWLRTNNGSVHGGEARVYLCAKQVDGYVPIHAIPSKRKLAMSTNSHHSRIIISHSLIQSKTAYTGGNSRPRRAVPPVVVCVMYHSAHPVPQILITALELHLRRTTLWCRSFSPPETLAYGASNVWFVVAGVEIVILTFHKVPYMETVEGAASGLIFASVSKHTRQWRVGEEISVGHLTEWWIGEYLNTGVGGDCIDGVLQAFCDHSSFAEEAATRQYP